MVVDSFFVVNLWTVSRCCVFSWFDKAHQLEWIWAVIREWKSVVAAHETCGINGSPSPRRQPNFKNRVVYRRDNFRWKLVTQCLKSYLIALHKSFPSTARLRRGVVSTDWTLRIFPFLGLRVYIRKSRYILSSSSGSSNCDSFSLFFLLFSTCGLLLLLLEVEKDQTDVDGDVNEAPHHQVKKPSKPAGRLFEKSHFSNVRHPTECNFEQNMNISTSRQDCCQYSSSSSKRACFSTTVWWSIKNTKTKRAVKILCKSADKWRAKDLEKWRVYELEVTCT